MPTRYSQALQADQALCGLAIPDGNYLSTVSRCRCTCSIWAAPQRHTPRGAIFYVPKLENEEEAAYLRNMIAAEALIAERHRDYARERACDPGLREPARHLPSAKWLRRSILLPRWPPGWHDYLASAALLFKHDPTTEFRLWRPEHRHQPHPEPSDPGRPPRTDRRAQDRDVWCPLRGWQPASFEVSMVGYIRDVVTQLKRGLDGFWVAHPSFVRIGIALTEAGAEAGKTHPTSSKPWSVPWCPTWSSSSPARALDVSDIEASPRIIPTMRCSLRILRSRMSSPTTTPKRSATTSSGAPIPSGLALRQRVVVFTTMKNTAGETVFVRIMDDLATTERSRWELWHEVITGGQLEPLRADFS